MSSYLFTHEARVTGEHGHYDSSALTLLDEAVTRTQRKPDEPFRTLSMKAGVLLSLHQFSAALAVWRGRSKNQPL